MASYEERAVEALERGDFERANVLATLALMSEVEALRVRFDDEFDDIANRRKESEPML